MEILSDNHKRPARLTIEAFKPVLGLFQPITFPAKTILLKPNSVCREAWFIDSGILRAYSISQEKKRSTEFEDSDRLNREITSWIVPEGGFLTDICSFLYQRPATSYIETLEPCRLYKLTYENYLTIQRSYPDLSRVIFENTLIMADLRVQMCTLRNPTDRLCLFERMYPGMSGRLSVSVQASYLNIDRVTLSRLRGKSKTV